MALRVPAIPFTFVAHTLAIAALVLVLVWNIHFRGGFAWEATNKNLIFNVSLSLSLSLWVLSFRFIMHNVSFHFCIVVHELDVCLFLIDRSM